MKKLLVISVMFLGSAVAGCAQQASILGIVTDSSGAVIPNAKITVSNPERGVIRHLTSNTAGSYVAADLPIGTYTVTAQVPGFRRLVTAGVVLQVGATRRVDMRLQVGQVTQAVQVTANVAHVQTETAAVSGVITGKQIANLELNGRDFVNLMLLVPGASPDNSLDLTNTVHGGADITVSVNGGRSGMNNFMINGMPSMDETGYGGLNVTPSLDSIQEFRVVTSTYGAEYGKLDAAQINVATKSGTKQFHGDAYDYVRNDAFDANPFFQNRQIAPPGGNAPKTPLKWNDFGYTFGGPIYIPHYYNKDKSKTFFFWSQEWHRYNGAEVINAGVPSMAERLGDFSECDPASGSFNPIIASGCTLPSLNGVNYDTVQQAPGFNPQAYTNGTILMNSLVPLPNNGPINYVHSSPSNTDWRQEMIRVD
ncbi:MAG: carboxypeptidase regulatory-like domain-containing protein, partial [Terriglobia bacterium]